MGDKYDDPKNLTLKGEEIPDPHGYVDQHYDYSRPKERKVNTALVTPTAGSTTTADGPYDCGVRRSFYQRDFCKLLIDHMGQGFSFLSFAGVIDVSTDILAHWVRQYPEFQEARSIGESKSLLFWENIGITNHNNTDLRQAVYIFAMKARFGWRENSQEVENAKPVVEIVINGENAGPEHLRVTTTTKGSSAPIELPEILLPEGFEDGEIDDDERSAEAEI